MKPAPWRQEFRADWESILSLCPDGLIFHTPQWLEALDSCYGLTTHHLLRNDRGSEGLLPIFEVKSPLLGHKLTTQPFNFYGGLIGCNENAQHQLLTQARDLWRRSGAKYLEIKNVFPLPQSLIDEFDLIQRSSFVSYVVPLQPDLVQLEATFQRRFREKLSKLRRKAADLGVELTEEVQPDRVLLRQFYDMLTEEYRTKHLMLVQPFKLFQTIGQFLGTNFHLVVARLKSKVIGGAVILRSVGTDYYMWGAYDLNLDELSPLTLVLAEAIRHAAANGQHSFDFGLTSRSHEGLNFFKSRWGSRCEPLNYYYLAKDVKDVPTLEYFNSYRSIRQLIKYVPGRVIQEISPLVISWLA